MIRHRLSFLHWPISTKLTVIFLVAILLPVGIVAVPAVDQRISNLREQNKVYLEALGPFEITRTEYAFQTLSTDLNGTLTALQTDYTSIETYLYQAPTALSETERQKMNQQMEIRMVRYLNSSPSLSRIRFVGTDGTVFIDKTIQSTVLSDTPALALIKSDEIGFRTTTSDIYADAEGHPSVDIIITLRPAWASTGYSGAIGHVVFTQNLLLAENDVTLPNLYGELRKIPESPHKTHIFLLNEQGQLVSPETNFTYFQDGSDSEGYRFAQQGKTGVSTYHSGLLDQNVMGYYQSVQLTNGPQVTILVETPLEDIDQSALEEIVFTLLPVVFGGILLGLGAALLASLLIARPLTQLTELTRQMASGQISRNLQPATRRDEIGLLHNTFVDMANQLLSAIQGLEQNVAERTSNLETILEIGRIITRLRDLDILLEEVVALIRDRFEKIYHTQVFLIDPHTGRAVLRASTGAVGRQLLQRGHYLDVGSQSVIGSVTATGHAVVALDTPNNPIHHRNVLLPDTRAEMALPLRVGNRVIGALDLQSTEADAFRESDVELFQGMADQITIAIESAMLFAESNARLREIEELNRLLSRDAWKEVTRGRTGTDLSAATGRQDYATNWTDIQMQAMRTRDIAERRDGDMITFAVPVLLRGEVLGAVEWQVPEARYSSDVRQTAFELTERLALTADNIRLFEQSRRAVQREQLVNQISSKLTGTTDIDQILQTAVRELGLALHIPQTAIYLSPPDSNTEKASE